MRNPLVRVGVFTLFASTRTLLQSVPEMESSDDELFVLESSALKFLVVDGEPFREEWVNEYFVDREVAGEYHRIFPDLLRQPDKFFEYFRMMPDTFFYILEKISPLISKNSNFRKCVSPQEKLMVTLRFLSTGLAFRSMAFSFKLANNTIAGIVYETCGAIWESFVGQHMPTVDKDTLQNAATEFMDKWGFPNCVGCLDGKHVRIKCPANSASKFYNYKTFFSVVLQGMADANSRFLSIDVGAYGRQSDSGILTNSALYEIIQNSNIMPDDKPLPYSGNQPAPSIPLPHVILGDQGYPLKTYLLKPYSRQSATEDELYFNYRLSSVRRVVECAFGMLVAKWRVLKTEIQCDPKNVDAIVKCACLLHNIVIDKEGNSDVTNYFVGDMEQHPLPSYRPSLDARRYNRSTKKSIKIRDSFKHYFKCGK